MHLKSQLICRELLVLPLRVVTAVSGQFTVVDFLVCRKLFCVYTGKEGDPTYMKSSDGSSKSREVAEA